MVHRNCSADSLGGNSYVFVAAVGFVLFCVCVCVCMWMVQEAVVRDKEDWVNKVAAEGEAAKKDGQVRLGSMHRLQKSNSGHRPLRFKRLMVN